MKYIIKNKIAMVTAIVILPLCSVAIGANANINHNGREITARYLNLKSSEIAYLKPLYITNKKIEQWRRKSYHIGLFGLYNGRRYYLGALNPKTQLQKAYLPKTKINAIQLFVVDNWNHIKSSISSRLTLDHVLPFIKPKAKPMLKSGIDKCNLNDGGDIKLETVKQVSGEIPQLYANGNQQVLFKLIKASGDLISPACSGLTFKFSLSINTDINQSIGHESDASAFLQGVSTQAQHESLGVEIKHDTNGYQEGLETSDGNVQNINEFKQQVNTLDNLMQLSHEKGDLIKSEREFNPFYYISVNKENFHTKKSKSPYPMEIEIGIKDAEYNGKKLHLNLTDGKARKINLLLPKTPSSPKMLNVVTTLDECSSQMNHGCAYEAIVKFNQDCALCHFDNPPGATLDQDGRFSPSEQGSYPKIQFRRVAGEMHCWGDKGYVYNVSGLMKVMNSETDGSIERVQMNSGGSQFNMNMFYDTSAYGCAENKNVFDYFKSKLYGVDAYGNPLSGLNIYGYLGVNPDNGRWIHQMKIESADKKE